HISSMHLLQCESCPTLLYEIIGCYRLFSIFFFSFFFVLLGLQRRSTLFPYTTLFRSVDDPGAQRGGGAREGGGLAERDAAQRAVLVQQGQVHGSHTSVRGSSSMRRPSAALVRPVSARRTPRAPERKSRG